MSDFHSMKLCHSVNWEEPKEVTEWHNLVIRSHFWPFSKNSADCMAQFFYGGFLGRRYHNFSNNFIRGFFSVNSKRLHNNMIDFYIYLNCLKVSFLWIYNIPFSVIHLYDTKIRVSGNLSRSSYRAQRYFTSYTHIFVREFFFF